MDTTNIDVGIKQPLLNGGAGGLTKLGSAALTLSGTNTYVSYLHTRTQTELFKLLDRGGVIGETSAGCSIQASHLVRGARSGNTVMMAPGYEEGFGFLRNIALDQHLLTRKRTNDLVAVVKRFPNLLGLGLDEDTAIIVRGDHF